MHLQWESPQLILMLLYMLKLQTAGMTRTVKQLPHRHFLIWAVMSWHSTAIHHIHRPWPRKPVYTVSVTTLTCRKKLLTSCLCSVIWNWSAYYTYTVQSLIDGTWTGKNYYGGMSEGLVGITSLADFCTKGTQEAVDDAKARFYQVILMF